MIVIPWGVVRHGECWFDDEPGPGVDVVQFVQAPEPKAKRFKIFMSPVIRLEKDSADILAAMNATTRNEVRRAQNKDLLKHEWIPDPTPESVDEFCDFYDDFARQKSVHLIAKPRVHAYRDNGVLRFSKVLAPDDTLLSWIALIAQGKRLRWLWGPSLFRMSDDQAFRQMVGRATRYNHYSSMIVGKELGMALYDLGGWHPGPNQSLLAVNRFKEGFGADILTEYNFELPLTPRGRAYMLVRNAWLGICGKR